MEVIDGVDFLFLPCFTMGEQRICVVRKTLFFPPPKTWLDGGTSRPFPGF